MISDPYCRKHNCNNCRACMFDKQTIELVKSQVEQTNRLIKANEDHAKSIINAINNKSSNCHKKRKSDLPSLIVQVLILGLLVYGFVSLSS